MTLEYDMKFMVNSWDQALQKHDRLGNIGWIVFRSELVDIKTQEIALYCIFLGREMR